MRLRIVGLLILLVFLVAVPIANADLGEFGFMWNGTFYYAADPLPSNFNMSAFDTMTGYGSIVITFGPGSQLFTSVFDHNLGQLWDKDLVGTGGMLDPGQSFEMGNPDAGLSTLVPDFFAEALNNQIDLPGLGEHDDWAMGMGYAFSVNPGEQATLLLKFGDIEPGSGFWMHQVGDGGEQMYMQGILRNGETPDAPEPATMALIGAGLLGIWLKRRK